MRVAFSREGGTDVRYGGNPDLQVLVTGHSEHG